MAKKKLDILDQVVKSGHETSGKAHKDGIEVIVTKNVEKTARNGKADIFKSAEMSADQTVGKRRKASA